MKFLKFLPYFLLLVAAPKAIASQKTSTKSEIKQKSEEDVCKKILTSYMENDVAGLKKFAAQRSLTDGQKGQLFLAAATVTNNPLNSIKAQAFSTLIDYIGTQADTSLWNKYIAKALCMKPQSTKSQISTFTAHRGYYHSSVAFLRTKPFCEKILEETKLIHENNIGSIVSNVTRTQDTFMVTTGTIDAVSALIRTKAAQENEAVHTILKTIIPVNDSVKMKLLMAAIETPNNFEALLNNSAFTLKSTDELTRLLTIACSGDSLDEDSKGYQPNIDSASIIIGKYGNNHDYITSLKSSVHEILQNINTKQLTRTDTTSQKTDACTGLELLTSSANPKHLALITAELLATKEFNTQRTQYLISRLPQYPFTWLLLNSRGLEETASNKNLTAYLDKAHEDAHATKIMLDDRVLEDAASIIMDYADINPKAIAPIMKKDETTLKKEGCVIS